MREFELVKYSIRHMCSKELAYKLLEQKNIQFKNSDTFEKLSNRIKPEDNILLSEICKLFRSEWKPCDIEFHINNLKSGLLKGHDWHGAMPSMLHLSMQDRVRDCISGKITLEQLLEIGTDIMKHEYFMVAAHDLCETSIINNFPDCIPPVGKKSISDFIFKGIPYDLKNTNTILGLNKDEINSNKKEVIEKLMFGADVSRIREQAKKTINNWGLNRFYFIVENQDRWLNDPLSIIQELIYECDKIENPIEIEIEKIKIQTLLISI
jgi:hypothetical protein